MRQRLKLLTNLLERKKFHLLLPIRHASKTGQSFMLVIQIFTHRFAHVENRTITIRTQNIIMKTTLTSLTLSPES